MLAHLTYTIKISRGLYTVQMYLNNNKGLHEDLKIVFKKDTLKKTYLKMIFRARELGLEIIGFPEITIIINRSEEHGSNN